MIDGQRIINRHKTGEGIESVRENTCMYIPMYVCVRTAQCMERIFHLGNDEKGISRWTFKNKERLLNSYILLPILKEIILQMKIMYSQSNESTSFLSLLLAHTRLDFQWKHGFKFPPSQSQHFGILVQVVISTCNVRAFEKNVPVLRQ